MGRLQFWKNKMPEIQVMHLPLWSLAFGRSLSPPNMFDEANRQTCAVRTRRTNTPLHALTLLNDKTYVEAARVVEIV